MNICVKCKEPFALVPDRPGYATVCPSCTESIHNQPKRIEAAVAVRERRKAADKNNPRKRRKTDHGKAELAPMGYEPVRYRSIQVPAEDEE